MRTDPRLEAPTTPRCMRLLPAAQRHPHWDFCDYINFVRRDQSESEDGRPALVRPIKVHRPRAAICSVFARLYAGVITPPDLLVPRLPPPSAHLTRPAIRLRASHAIFWCRLVQEMSARLLLHIVRGAKDHEVRLRSKHRCQTGRLRSDWGVTGELWGVVRRVELEKAAAFQVSLHLIDQSVDLLTELAVAVSLLERFNILPFPVIGKVHRIAIHETA